LTRTWRDPTRQLIHTHIDRVRAHISNTYTFVYYERIIIT